MDIKQLIRLHSGARHIIAKLYKCRCYTDVVECRGEFNGYLSCLRELNEISSDEQTQLIQEFDKLKNKIFDKKRGATI